MIVRILTLRAPVVHLHMPRALTPALAKLHVPLLVILIFQGVVSLTLRNTAFQDEALYLYAGQQYFHALMGGPAVVEPYGLYFSGTPYFYPVIAGALDAWRGLEAARLLSLVCMLGATMMVYVLTKHLFNRQSALLAAALFAMQGNVLFLGRLATYDAMSLAFLSLAVVLALRASTAKWPFLALSIGPVLLFAVAAKYAGLLWVPSVLAILGWQTLRAHGWRQAVVRVGIVVTVMVSLLAVAMFSARADLLAGLRATTTGRVALLSAARRVLLERSLTIAGLLLALALIGVALSGWRRLPLTLMLFGSGLLAPAYHIYKTEAVSLHKHIAFGFLFVAPLAGHAVPRLIGAGGRDSINRRWLVSLAVCLVVFGVGLHQAQGYFSEWSNSNQAIHVMRTQVRPNAGRVLSEESEVERYYMQDIVAFWQWNHLNWFQYTDAQGTTMTGEPAYKAAIADGYFDLVVLRYGANAAMANAIDGGLRDGTRYEPIAKIPTHTQFGDGYYWIWRKRS